MYIAELEFLNFMFEYLGEIELNSKIVFSLFVGGLTDSGKNIGAHCAFFLVF